MKMLIDTTLCIECQACVVACLQENSRENPWPRIKACTSSPKNCRHCAEPACTAFCPSGALKKTEAGVVTWEEELCLGCKLCLSFCPFGSVNFDLERGQPAKCLFCPERLKAGLEPACTTVCPTGARVFGEEEEIERLVRDRIAELKSKGRKAFLFNTDAHRDGIIILMGSEEEHGVNTGV